MKNRRCFIPIKNLKDTQKISNNCHKADEHVFVTKNGYNDLVIMSQDVYDREKLIADACVALAESESDVANGRVMNAKEAVSLLREKHDLQC